MSSIDWKNTEAALWRSYNKSLRAVRRRDPIRLDDLLGIQAQKQKVVQNTERFLAGQPCNHVLLWGSRGTGKSSIVKALLNEYAPQGLRLIQVDKDELAALPEIVDDIRERSQRFIVYCDDLSFDEGEHGYKHLKTVMEGSIELPPENVRIYASSNRRHLLPEYSRDNLQSKVIDGELHLGDAIEERISLADRFGLSVSFYPISEQGYFEMIDHLFPDVADRDALHMKARLFATQKGGRSGRTAQQFWNQFSER